jgi:hypothetical protein
MTPGLEYHQIDAAADDGVRNSQPEGIGRVAALDRLVCWNNLGRNVVFADRGLRPCAVFGTTLFPNQDEPSQYDLDVHSILEVPELGLVVVLNHLGAVRGFRHADILERANGRPIEPSLLWWFLADVERTITVAGRLVGSAPRSDGGLGLLVSSCLDDLPDGASIPTRSGALAFGEVTALAVVPSDDGPLIAIGGVAKVALLPVIDDQVGRPSWETDLGFRVATLAWHRGVLWAAGPDCAETVDDYDWERLGGGGYAALDPTNGATVMGGPLPTDVAWGTGGVAVAPFGHLLAVAGRTGCLHLIDPRRGARLRSTSSLGGVSLGIAHAAVVGDQVLCGFNRGGYRLHSFTQSAWESDS